MKNFSDTVPRQQWYREIMINRFVSFAYDNCEYVKSHLLLTESQLMKWMTQIARGFCLESAMRNFAAVDKFLQYLKNNGVISANPMRVFIDRFGQKGWNGIAKALKSKDYHQELSSLRVNPRFTGVFGKQAKTYISIHRAAGAKYKANEYILMEFNQFLRKHKIGSLREITPGIVLEWTRSQTCQQVTRRSKLLRLAHFFRYMCSLKHVSHSPVTPAVIDSFGPPGQSFKPYIYSRQEVTALLERSKQLESDIWYKLKPETFYTFISMLYTLGLRVSEALRLRICDINTNQRTVFIRKSKFYKERVLPYGPKLGECIQRYLYARREVLKPVTAKDPFFIGRYCEFLPATKVDKFFPKLLCASGINVSDDRRRPRLHDLRHTFAVHRLLKWYQESVDVQSKLVLLATFMGHVEIYSTQIYLTITDSLLGEANKRFYNEFGIFFEQETIS
jgi:site-specific recombinase XerD